MQYSMNVTYMRGTWTLSQLKGNSWWAYGIKKKHTVRITVTKILFSHYSSSTYSYRTLEPKTINLVYISFAPALRSSASLSMFQHDCLRSSSPHTSVCPGVPYTLLLQLFSLYTLAQRARNDEGLRKVARYVRAYRARRPSLWRAARRCSRRQLCLPCARAHSDFV